MCGLCRRPAASVVENVWYRDFISIVIEEMRESGVPNNVCFEILGPGGRKLLCCAVLWSKFSRVKIQSSVMHV
jgi:hypothetical protein